MPSFEIPAQNRFYTAAPVVDQGFAASAGAVGAYPLGDCAAPCGGTRIPSGRSARRPAGGFPVRSPPPRRHLLAMLRPRAGRRQAPNANSFCFRARTDGAVQSALAVGRARQTLCRGRGFRIAFRRSPVKLNRSTTAWPSPSATIGGGERLANLITKDDLVVRRRRVREICNTFPTFETEAPALARDIARWRGPFARRDRSFRSARPSGVARRGTEKTQIELLQAADLALRRRRRSFISPRVDAGGALASAWGGPASRPGHRTRLSTGRFAQTRGPVRYEGLLRWRGGSTPLSLCRSPRTSA